MAGRPPNPSPPPSTFQPFITTTVLASRVVVHFLSLFLVVPLLAGNIDINAVKIGQLGAALMTTNGDISLKGVLGEPSYASVFSLASPSSLLCAWHAWETHGVCLCPKPVVSVCALYAVVVLCRCAVVSVV